MNYYFYLTLFTMGELWTIIVLFFVGFFLWCCVVWGIFLNLFLEKNNRAQIIVSWTKVGDTSDSVWSRRRRDFLSDSIS